MALNLTAVIQKLQGLASRKQGRHVEALKRLSAIFGDKIDLMVPEEHLPRQSSSNPTAPAQLKNTPRVHARQTRANTPGMLPVKARTLPPISEGGQRAN